MATSDPSAIPSENLSKNPKPGVASAGQSSLNSLLPSEGDADLDQDGLETIHPPRGFMNQPWVQNVLPLATSLFFHAVLITIGIIVLHEVPKFINPNKEQVIIPDSKPIEKNAMPGGIEHPGLDNDKTRTAAQDLVKNTDDQGFSASAANNLSSTGGGKGDEESAGFEGASASTGKGTSGAGGAGNAFGSGSGGGTAPWGVPGGGGGLLPKSNFMGTGGDANKIIYLCDASGSMLSVFGALKQQLKESINGLDVPQQFNVIFFYDDQSDALFKDHQMHLASPANKKLAMDFVDNAVSTGGTQPLPAIKETLSEKPELIYLETDGFDAIASFDDVINAFKTGNPDGKIHINCIFLQSDEDPKLVEVLKQIATQGHGQFKKILKSDM